MALNLKEQKKLQYAILQSIAAGHDSLYAENFHVTEEEFDEATKAIEGSNYVRDAKFYFSCNFAVSPANITEKGEIFLHDNSKWGKALKLAKSIGDFVHSVKT